MSAGHAIAPLTPDRLATGRTARKDETPEERLARLTARIREHHPRITWPQEVTDALAAMAARDLATRRG